MKLQKKDLLNAQEVRKREKKKEQRIDRVKRKQIV